MIVIGNDVIKGVVEFQRGVPDIAAMFKSHTKIDQLSILMPDPIAHSNDPISIRMVHILSITCRLAKRADAQIKGRILSEPGELGRPPLPASAQLNVADLGENGFGSFCRNKRTSAAGPNPGHSNRQAQATGH